MQYERTSETADTIIPEVNRRKNKNMQMHNIIAAIAAQSKCAVNRAFQTERTVTGRAYIQRPALASAMAERQHEEIQSVKGERE